MDNDSFSVASSTSNHSSTNGMDCDELYDVTTTGSTTRNVVQSQQHSQDYENTGHLSTMSSNNNEDFSNSSIVNIDDYGYNSHQNDDNGDHDDDQDMDNDDPYRCNSIQQHFRHPQQVQQQQQQQQQHPDTPPALSSYYGSNHRPQQQHSARNRRHGSHITHNSNSSYSSSSYSSNSLNASGSFHASGSMLGGVGGRPGVQVPFVSESTVALLDSAAATIEAISQLTLQRTNHSTASSISATSASQANLAAVAAASTLNHVLNSSVHTTNSNNPNQYDDSTEDLGYEPCAPQARRGSMALNDEKQRRASIQAVMADKTLSPLSKRKSIQSLMDGRRRSMTNALPSTLYGSTEISPGGMGTTGLPAMSTVASRLPPRFGNRRNSMSGFIPSNQNPLLVAGGSSSFNSGSGIMYGQQGMTMYNGTTGSSVVSGDYGSSTSAPPFGRGVAPSTSTGSCTSSLHSSNHSPVRMRANNAADRISTLGYDSIIIESNTTGDSSDTIDNTGTNTLPTRDESYHSVVSGTTINSSIHSHGFGLGGSYHNSTLDGSSFHRAHQNSIDGSSFHRTYQNSIDGNSFHQTHHGSIDGNSFHRTHHGSIDGSSFHRTHHGSIDGNSYHRTHQNSLDGNSFHNNVNINRKNGTMPFHDSFNSETNPYEYNTPLMHGSAADTTCTTVLSTGTNSTINADNSSHYSSTTTINNNQQQQIQVQQPRYHFIQQQQHVHQVNQQQPYFAISNDHTRETEMNRPQCTHYERNCTIIAACCGAAFGCRLCHDESTNLYVYIKKTQAFLTFSAADKKLLKKFGYYETL
jgi:hypothetical protein